MEPKVIKSGRKFEEINFVPTKFNILTIFCNFVIYLTNRIIMFLQVNIKII